MPTKRYQATLYHDVDDDCAVIRCMEKAQYPQHVLRLLVSLGVIDSTSWPAPEPVTRRHVPCTRVLIRLYDSEAIAAINKYGLGTLRLLLQRGIRLFNAGKVAPAIQTTLPTNPISAVATTTVSTVPVPSVPSSSRSPIHSRPDGPSATQGTRKPKPAASQLKGLFG